MGVFQYEKVKDPTYYGENRVAAHSDHRYYGSVEEMEPHPTPVPIAVTTAMTGHATLTADNAVSPIRLLTNKPSIIE